MPRLQVHLLVALATLSVSAFGQSTNQARPGTLNYVEGTAAIGRHVLSSRSVGSAELQPGQTLTTQNGKAEILLTPGVFLRVGDNSSVKMIAPDLTHTEVDLLHGQALIEVDQIYRQNDLLVDQNGGQTELLKVGLYGFNADTNSVRVFDGKAAFYPGDTYQPNQKPVLVKGSRELAVNGELAKPQDFDKNKVHDDLYNWSSLRSQYLGQANLDLAMSYAGSPGFYPGWFWNAGLYGYTWLPGDGLFWSPFGFGFYSPYYIYGGGYIYGRGHYGGGYGGHYGGYGHAPIIRPGGGGMGGGFAHGGGGGGGVHR
ncbi:FecR domain-containing protein [Silvibacterium acidisoli]|uniref:FecR domain-containing protein n=1 Tax=Acidobacteriaceae bacterium ZG23-2 TaxID=2883246 RepID=UPI00406D1C87